MQTITCYKWDLIYMRVCMSAHTHTHTDKYNFNNRERKSMAPKHTPPHNVRQAPRVL